MITQIHFNPDGEYNGKSSWISDDSVYKIIWDTSVSKWKLSGGTLGFSVYNSTPTYPPFTGWYILGGSGDVTVYEGTCNPTESLRFTYSVNQPGCVCDGTITFYPTGDNFPFLYSIDGGVTYSNSPIFTDLCSGVYSLKVQDSLFNVVSDTTQLNPLQPIVSYSITTNTTSSVLVNTSVTKTVQNITTISVNPPLPAGVSITFNLTHLNGFRRSPIPGSGLLTTNTILEKNSVPVIVTSTNNSAITSFNTLPGCESEIEYYDVLDESWAGLTIQSGDNYIINTITTVQQHCMDACCYAESSDSYQVQSVSISGCDCCNLQSIGSYE